MANVARMSAIENHNPRAILFEPKAFNDRFGILLEPPCQRAQSSGIQKRFERRKPAALLESDMRGEQPAQFWPLRCKVAQTELVETLPQFRVL